MGMFMCAWGIWISSMFIVEIRMSGKILSSSCTSLVSEQWDKDEKSVVMKSSMCSSRSKDQQRCRNFNTKINGIKITLDIKASDYDL